LGIGDWAQSPIPNPQSPIPNPQSPCSLMISFITIKIFLKIKKKIIIFIISNKSPKNEKARRRDK
jgi:hypothetical protein